MKEEIKQILKELIEILEEGQLNITDAELVDFALRIYNTNKINNKHIYPINEFKSDSKTNPLTSQEQPATDKQKYLIKKFGKVIPAGLSKAEAMKIIQNLKKEE